MRSSRLPVAGLVLLAAILIPFFLWEDAIRIWFADLVTSSRGRPAVAAAMVGLLAADIVLPVPSSLVSTAAGGLLGFAWGTIASWLGMTAGSLIGYALGRYTPANRWLTRDDMERLDRAKSRFGDWLVIVFRSVPVLAEASAVFAGLSRMPVGRFVLLAGLANFAISAIYAATGAFAVATSSFLYAFFGAIALPGLAMLVFRK